MGRIITDHKEPVPTERSEAMAASRKTTGLRRGQRARHLEDEQVMAKYQGSCRKLVENGSAVIGAETAAVGAIKIFHAPLSFHKFGKAAQYSVKSGRQAIRTEIYGRELVERKYNPGFGLVKDPQSMTETDFIQELKPYQSAALRGYTKGFVSEALKDFSQAGGDISSYTDIPIGKCESSHSCDD